MRWPGGARPPTDRVAALAFLCLAGAAVGALALLMPAWPEGSRSMLLGWLAAVAAIGGGLRLAARRGLVPGLPMLMVLVALTITLVAAAAYAAGPHGAAPVGVLLVLPAGYASYAFPRRWALALIGYGAGALGLALWVSEAPWAAAAWVLVSGTALVAGATVSRLGRQAQDRFQAQRDLTHALQETEAVRADLFRAARHDAGAPLTAMVGLVQTVRDHLDDLPPDAQRDLLDRAAANAHRVARILEDLADLATACEAPAQPRREQTDLAALARKVADSLAPPDRPLRVDAEPVTVRVDPNKVERIIQNLLVNALTHTSADVPVTVRVHPHEGGATLIVEDAGTGVPDDRKQAVFEPFVRDSAGPPGSGLGLAVVRQFARAHGGDTWVEDRPGGGARFVVHLPAPEHARGQPLAGRAPPTCTSPGTQLAPPGRWTPPMPDDPPRTAPRRAERQARGGPGDTPPSRLCAS